MGGRDAEGSAASSVPFAADTLVSPPGHLWSFLGGLSRHSTAQGAPFLGSSSAKKRHANGIFT